MGMKKLLIVLVVIGSVAACVALWAWSMVNVSVNDSDEGVVLFVYPGDSPEVVRDRLGAPVAWDWLTAAGYGVRAGRYVVEPGESVLQVYRRVRAGAQSPMRLVVPSVRTMSQMAGRLGRQLLLDSVVIAEALADEGVCERLGYSTQTVPALFIPNSYEVYWTIGVDELLARMKREHDAFWTAERRAKAERWGLSELEVSTLASIVESETADDGEKPMIAGLYYRRLKRGMLLQADPTVIFGIGDFSIRRVLNRHLAYDSPYNTYIYRGLPPGPIRVPSVVGLEAVLNLVEHDFVYMCAKEDFSGTHNFARTAAEHQANARKYTDALNRRGIK